MIITLLTLSLLASPTPITDYVKSNPIIAEEISANDRKWERIEVALVIESLSATIIEYSITSFCLAEGTCIERMWLANKLFRKSPGKAIIFKGIISGTIHYILYRLPAPKKLKRIVLFGVAGMNTAIAIHNFNVIQDSRAK